MKIRMLTGMSGVNFSLSPKEETDRFSETEAVRLINAGYAEEVKGEAPSASAARAKPKGKASAK